MTKLDVQVGDLVQTKPGVVKRVYTTNKGDTVLWVDVPGGYYGDPPARFYITEIEMVRRLPRRPKVGDVITPRELKDTQWKRGSMFRSVIADQDVLDNWFLVVRGDGRLETVGAERPEVFSFEDYFTESSARGINDREVWEVVFLP